MFLKQQIIRRKGEFHYKEIELIQRIPEKISAERLEQSIFFEGASRAIYKTDLNNVIMTADKATLVSFLDGKKTKEELKKELFKTYEKFLEENEKEKEELLNLTKKQRKKFLIWKSEQL